MAEKKIWFKAKWYGWGWYPASWQGWLIILIFITLSAVAGIIFLGPYEDGEAPLGNMLAFFAVVAVSVFGLLRLSYKYGEKPGWRWGRK